MNIREKVLIIEDEKYIAGFIQMMLVQNDYDVLCASTGNAALSLIHSHCPDLIILDLGLPDIDGMDIIRSVREWTQLPILVVSARTNEGDKVAALDAGADDYITKPFSSEELLARVRVALRHIRNAKITTKTPKFVSGNLEIDYDKHMVLVNGKNCHLTQNEYRIVLLLSRFAGKVLTHDYIMRELWGPMNNRDNQILRVNMANIRRKIEENPANPKYIFTEVGVGYRMAEADEHLT